MQANIKMKTQLTKSAIIQIFTTINNFICFLFSVPDSNLFFAHFYISFTAIKLISFYRKKMGFRMFRTLD